MPFSHLLSSLTCRHCFDSELHKDVLENYVVSVFKNTSIVIYRSPKKLGLIQARSVGVKIAKGPVVMVMDIHFEVQPHW